MSHRQFLQVFDAPYPASAQNQPLCSVVAEPYPTRPGQMSRNEADIRFTVAISDLPNQDERQQKQFEEVDERPIWSPGDAKEQKNSSQSKKEVSDLDCELIERGLLVANQFLYVNLDRGGISRTACQPRFRAMWSFKVIES